MRLLLIILFVAGCAAEGRDVAKAAEGKEEAGKPDPSAANEKPEKPLEWERPRFEEGQATRDRMVKTQMRDVKDKKVLEAMRNVPRHMFVPKSQQGAAYTDKPLPIGYGQTISQPYIVAYMTEKLQLKPGDKVLEIGTGSGYQAAILSELTPNVYSIEIVRQLAQSVEKRFKDLGYKTIRTKHDDGYHGWKEHAPFDAIIVTCAAGHIPPPLVKQLKDGGRMCIPVGGPFVFQQLMLVEKKGDEVKSKALMGVVFVPLTRSKKSQVE